MLTITALGLAVSLLVILLRHPIGDALTGSLPQESANVAAESLAFLVPAAFVQLLAAIAASALAARDDYDIAAIAYAAGGIAGVIFFVLTADAHGPVALAWATVLNCAITFGIPFVALLVRGDLGGGSVPLGVGGRGLRPGGGLGRADGDRGLLRGQPALRGHPWRRQGDDLYLRLSDRLGVRGRDGRFGRPRLVGAADPPRARCRERRSARGERILALARGDRRGGRRVRPGRAALRRPRPRRRLHRRGRASARASRCLSHAVDVRLGRLHADLPAGVHRGEARQARAGGCGRPCRADSADVGDERGVRHAGDRDRACHFHRARGGRVAR